MYFFSNQFEISINASFVSSCSSKKKKKLKQNPQKDQINVLDLGSKSSQAEEEAVEVNQFVN